MKHLILCLAMIALCACDKKGGDPPKEPLQPNTEGTIDIPGFPMSQLKRPITWQETYDTFKSECVPDGGITQESENTTEIYVETSLGWRFAFRKPSKNIAATRPIDILSYTFPGTPYKTVDGVTFYIYSNTIGVNNPAQTGPASAFYPRTATNISTWNLRFN